ncbi:MAG TPA: hypothetical protein VHC47_02505 [Mucilaginibacter sp.]|nr:hypothetical protein [Mucilaginibacter sp.]
MLRKGLIWLCPVFILFTSFVVPGNAIRPASIVKKWVVNGSSSLCVNGSTNINKFSCEIPSYDQTDTITVTEDAGDRGVRLSGGISLKVQSFDCHNVIMTADLRKTLKEKQFPMLDISFLSLNCLPGLTSRPEAVTGLVNIEIAGVTRRFEINYQVSKDAHGTIRLVGTQHVNFTDFNLVPPKKLGGMIRTNDQLSVAFQLNMKALD